MLKRAGYMNIKINFFSLSMFLPLGLFKAAIVEPHSAGWETIKGGPFRVPATAPFGREFCVGQMLVFFFISWYF